MFRRALIECPTVVDGLPRVQAILECGVRGIALEHRDAAEAILCFWTECLRVTSASSSISLPELLRLTDIIAPCLVEAIFRSLPDSYSRVKLRATIDVLRALLETRHALCMQMFPALAHVYVI